MVDPVLISVSVIIPFLLIFFNLLVMAHYIDPQAAAGHFLAKLIILLGMLMAECTVLLLPLDVGNMTGTVGCGIWNNNCGGLNMALAWQVAYCIIAGLIVVVIPFFIFYYEDDDGCDSGSPTRRGPQPPQPESSGRVRASDRPGLRP